MVIASVVTVTKITVTMVTKETNKTITKRYFAHYFKLFISVFLLCNDVLIMKEIILNKTLILFIYDNRYYI